MHEGEMHGQGLEQPQQGNGKSRPQQGGEAGTTRFGMEDGDNTDVPATGGPTSDDDAAEQPS